MSDNSNSTGSSGSSTNSWTLLSPEEAAVESVGPVDDGTESLGDVPSLSEEVAGATVEFKPSDIPVETVLSEEGHRICQETSPESSEGPVPSSPSRMSPLPPSPLNLPDLDLENQPPVIHDIDTSSPSDNELLGAIPFVTNITLDFPDVEFSPAEPEVSCAAGPMSQIAVSTEAAPDTPADIGLIHASLAVEGPEFDIPAETITVADPPSHFEADVSFVPEITELPKLAAESLVTEHMDESVVPETIGSEEAEEDVENEAAEPFASEIEEQEPSTSFVLTDTSSFDDGLRRRNVASYETPASRTSDEEEEVEEVEFKLVEKREEKPWFSLNKCIVGGLILLFLGSLFLSGEFDASELSEKEQSQSQKEDLALKSVAANSDEKVRADLEKENAMLKEELSSLPDLKAELESLRARVTELSQLTAVQEKPPVAPSSAPLPGDKYGESIQKAAEPEWTKDTKKENVLNAELQRQKALQEESGKRLEGMKKQGGNRKQVRDSLEEIQRKISEQVESWGKKKKKPQEPKCKGKSNEQDSEKEALRKQHKEWERKKGERKMDRKARRKEKPWHSQPGGKSHHHHYSHEYQQQGDFWRDQEQKLQRSIRPQLGCGCVEDCASKEGLYPVELPEFEELLEAYLDKLEESSTANKDRLRELVAEFFKDDVFIHDRVRFRDFAEDIADILEDMVDVLEGKSQKDGESLEEDMEEFEREALWMFSATF